MADAQRGSRTLAGRPPLGVAVAVSDDGSFIDTLIGEASNFDPAGGEDLPRSRARSALLIHATRRVETAELGHRL